MSSIDYSSSVIWLSQKTSLALKLRTEFTSPIAKSTSPGLSDTTLFVCCVLPRCSFKDYSFRVLYFWLAAITKLASCLGTLLVFYQVLITEDFLQRLDKDVDDLTRPNEVIIVIYSSIKWQTNHWQRSGLDPWSSLNFFRFFFNSLVCLFNCEDHIHFYTFARCLLLFPARALQ